jgi:two-component system, chemotaxis family, CheB/CheR fusion protein
VPGCATGEEAYTIAILLEEVMQEIDTGESEARIFATDLNRSMLDIAGRGHYPASIAHEFPPGILEKYFSPRGDSFVVSRSLRERIVFARHNVLKDPPFTRLDLVSCRNLLIYLEAASQEALLSTFHFSLLECGALFLGKSEALGPASHLFTPVDASTQLFRRSDTGAAPRLRLASQMPGEIWEATRAGRGSQSHHSHLLEKLLNVSFLRSGRTCFVLNRDLEVLYSFGNPGRFVEMTRGRTTFIITDLLHPALVAPLTSMAGSLLEHDGGRTVGPLPVPLGGKFPTVALSLELFDAPDSDHQFLLALLDEDFPEPPQSDGIGESLRRITELENEVLDRKERLRFVLQELEAANEELITSNEQLQSANEELESLNEELQSSNVHCRVRIDELEKLHDDLGSFIESADFGILFIDFEMRIRRHTPVAAAMTGLLPHDEGRLVTDLSHPLLREAAEAARSIIGGGEDFIKMLESPDGDPLLLRASPYVRKDGARVGASVCMVPLPSSQGR